MTTTDLIKKILLLFLVVAGLYYAKEFLIPLSIGALLATLFLPFCKWMESKKVPKVLSVFICLLTLLLAITSVGALVAWQVAELTSDITLIKLKTVETIHNTQQYVFSHFGISTAEQSQLIKNQQNSITGFISATIGSLAYILTSFVLMLVYVFLLLYYRVHLKSFILKLSLAANQKEAEQVIYSATNVSQQYLLGLTKMIVCLWIMYGFGFSLLGLKNALFFAFLCGLLEIVPFVGNIIGTSLTVLVAAIHGGSFPLLGGIVLTYGVVQLIQGWILEPLILGPQVKINPLFTIIALVFGELIWGVPGIILAIPFIAMLKIVCDHIEALKPYGFLIGEIKSPKKGPAFIDKIKKFV